MFVASVPFLVLLVGLLMFALSKPGGNPDVKEIGRIMFFCGLLVALFGLPHMVHLLP